VLANLGKQFLPAFNVNQTVWPLSSLLYNKYNRKILRRQALFDVSGVYLLWW